MTMVLQARLKPLGRDQHIAATVVRAVCGRALPCPGELGLLEYQPTGWRLQPRPTYGYHRPDALGFYRVMLFQTARLPRRPMAPDVPSGFERRTFSQNIQGDVWRGLRGQAPKLPAVIYCPVSTCGQPNRVEPPAA